MMVNPDEAKRSNDEVSEFSQFWSNISPLSGNRVPGWHSELSWVSLVVVLQIGFLACGLSLGLLSVDGRVVLALGIAQCVLQAAFLSIYSCACSRLLPLDLVFLLHQVLTGSLIIVTAQCAHPYSFEVMLFYIPLILIGYNVTRISSKVVIALLGAVGFLILLAIQNVPLWTDKNFLHHAILPLWRWLSFFSLCLLAFMISVLCAYLYRLADEKNHQLLKVLREKQLLTTRDDLTGLYNQRYMIDQLDKQKNIADRGEYSFVLAAVSIDDFQNLVDSHSDAAADEVVITVGKILGYHIRKVDVGARWDDDTFLVLLINTTLEQSKSVFERISLSVQERNFLSVGVDDMVSISVGVTQYMCAENWESVVERALLALDSAKEKGSNRIETLLPTTRCVELFRDYNDRFHPL